MTLIPGAVVTNPDIFAITTGLNSTNQVINGNRADSANLTVDGAFNQASGSNGSLINNVGADFIQEVKIETSNFSAEYGRTSGPAFNIVTKSGTNQFHGSAFEYVRNNLFDARPFLQRVQNATWSITTSAMVSVDRSSNRSLFFFVGEEWKRLTATTGSIYLLRSKHGDAGWQLPGASIRRQTCAAGLTRELQPRSPTTTSPL